MAPVLGSLVLESAQSLELPMDGTLIAVVAAVALAVAAAVAGRIGIVEGVVDGRDLREGMNKGQRRTRFGQNQTEGSLRPEGQ